eukprot:GFYU01019825.1.p1 GENE.GFYU01019825.1~~GFYU01019825.1.p1  ORF type:complete len:681 (+),score=216.14 GFYU01019825.1:122-2164(+)
MTRTDDVELESIHSDYEGGVTTESSMKEVKDMDPLSRRDKMLYSFPRLTTVAMMLYLQTQGRKYYVDDLKMEAGNMAMLVAVCKSLDVIIGLGIGYGSDHIETRYGRRKPFIAFGFPVWCASFLAILNPPGGSETDIMIYFAIFYFLFYSMGTSITLIPYDALGMELTPNYDERSSLFGYKGTFQNLGYAFQGVAALVLASIFPDSLRSQNLYNSLVWSAMTLFAFSLLLKYLQCKNPLAMQAVQDDTPMVPLVRSLARNSAYLTYLGFKIPAAISALMPVTFLPYYLQYYGQTEKWSAMMWTCIIIVVLAAVLSVPALVYGCRKYGKREVLFWNLMFQGFVYCGAVFLPYSDPVIYVTAICVGIGIAATNVIPDAMLADIIDYDTLHTGQRREALYTVVETNLQQFIEIPSGTIPLLVFAAVGYVNNGGCYCGCGVECDSGKTTMSDCVAPSDFGAAPCTYQNEQVQWAIRMFFLFVPGVMAFVAGYPVWKSPITQDLHSKIVEETAKRKDGHAAVDPLTDTPVIVEEKSESRVWRDHFSDWELEKGSQWGAEKFRILLGLQLMWWVSLLVIDIVLMSQFPNQNAVATGAIVGSVIFIFIAWDAARLRLLFKTDIDQIRSYITKEKLQAHKSGRSMSTYRISSRSLTMGVNSKRGDSQLLTNERSTASNLTTPASSQEE